RLSIELKTLILQYLDQRSVHGDLKYGALTAASLQFGYHRHTIETLWINRRESIALNTAFKLEAQYKGKVGRKWVPYQPHQISRIPARLRTTQRDLGVQMDRLASTINRHKNKGEITTHSNTLKPGLTEANKRKRVKYCIDQIEPDTLNSQPKFNAMANIVHIDEKWFFLTRKNLHMYLAPKEKGPHRSTKSKNSIPKVMFMSAVARPRRNSDGAFTFPGKIRIWPFTYKYVEKKSSVNRPRGTIETKAITKVDKLVFRKMMTENVIPAIKAQWPREEGNTTITIQADNAKPRGGADIYSFIESHSDENFTFKWAPQPANSLDLNILDLGLFNSLQSKYQKTMLETIDKMVEEVGKVYEDQHLKTISNV
ncbi:Sodium/potassium-transporting ATPase subunit beta-1-interacting protein 4, partial [Bienertia sinuspersici]